MKHSGQPSLDVGLDGFTMTAAEMRRRLRAKFGRTTETVPVPEHALLFEVPVDGVWRLKDGRVFSRARRRRIDVVAVGLWKRTDHLVHGFEVKVSRSDLLAELRDPDKAGAAIAKVDRWWLALGDRRLLRDGDELPPGWGIIAPHGRGLTVLAEPAPTGGTPDARFVAALVQTTIAGRGTVAHGLGFQEGYRRGIDVGRRLAAWR